MHRPNVFPPTRTRFYPPFYTRLCLLLFLLSTPLMAQAQNAEKVTYPFSNGDTIPLSLSSINLNRLVVANDRILSIVCPQGFCTSSGNQKDASGSITLKINIALPFTAHLTTEKGRLFALFISPKATPGFVSEFTWAQSHLEQDSVMQTSADYPKGLTRLTKAMMRFVHDKAPIEGFSQHPVDPATLPDDDAALAVIPTTVFVGRDYSGIIYTLRNQTQTLMTLTTAQFYSDSARSAALEAYELAPGASTTLYLITGGGAAHVR
ncbi:putative conjugative transfer protein TraK (plasmid) [Vibrio tapetis subsp. tapetis]|uniref:Putative conjugative transfer protein TraK n=2 Tax=Vibrio tapetis TaxID=52443 RepID=A0A2N8ZI59_9VIBR|nr:putative conjugative transfer protein TraK [Vibrio tapetis subsp. tapetis]SON53425.1 putative conjugative transfer protein TraK [Vibrio tapetis subsp. tapetis]SON53455.1 putative conjugative transfer protein TraK [Vibrio tapetis subsp. tapetis]